MKLKYGLFVLALIVCIVGGAYATGTGPDDITNDLTNLIGAITNHNSADEQAPITTDPANSANNAVTPESASATSDALADNINNNVIASVQTPVYTEQGPNTPIIIGNNGDTLINGNYGGPIKPNGTIIPGQNSGNYGGPSNPHGGIVNPGQNSGNYGGPSNPIPGQSSGNYGGPSKHPGITINL